jgi:hypothetical protein
MLKKVGVAYTTPYLMLLVGIFETFFDHVEVWVVQTNEDKKKTVDRRYFGAFMEHHKTARYILGRYKNTCKLKISVTNFVSQFIGMIP